MEDLYELIQHFGIDLQDIYHVFSVLAFELLLNAGTVDIVVEHQDMLVFFKDSFEELNFLFLVPEPGVGFPFLKRLFKDIWKFV